MQNERLERRRFLQGLMAAGAVGPMAHGEDNKLRIGVVGLGWRGKSDADDIQKLAAAGYPVEITAVCDLYQPRLERAETRYKARGYEHTADMLKNAPLDAVLIATPDRHHLPNLQEAIRAGKDVYIEKPLCHWAQFDLLKAVVHENRKLNRIVQVGSQHLADSVWERAGELLGTGAIGKPVHIQVPNFRNSDGGERSPTFIDDPNAKAGVGLNWEKWQGDAPRHAFTIERFFQWRMFAEYSGGPVTDTGVHSISPVYKMLEKLDVGMPHKVMATGGRFYYGEPRTAPDTMDVLMQYPQNFTVALLETYVNNQFPIETVIRCAEGSIIRRSEGVEFVPMAREGMGWLTPDAKKAETKPNTLLRSDLAGQLAAEGGQRRYIDPTGEHIRNFLDCVRSRKQPRYSLELGYIVQVPFCMAMRSHLENKVALWDRNREEIRMS